MCLERRARPFTTVLTTGDNFYPSGVATDRNFRRPFACLIEAGVRWRATWGNHDSLGGTSTRTELGAAHFYAWSEAGADFIALDANRPGNDQQLRWLRDRLESSVAAVKIVYFHQPPFSAGEHPDNEGVKRWWVPLFTKHDVTLVLSGHNHDYEHLRVDGIDYVTTGGGGQGLYDCKRRPRALITCMSQHHFLLLTVDGTRVRVEAVARSGARIDDFTIDS